MKIILIKDNDGKTCGWTLQAESIDDRLTLGTIRDFHFWGNGDTKIEYDGYRAWDEDDNYVDSINYKTHKVVAEERTAMLNRIENLRKYEDN